MLMRDECDGAMQGEEGAPNREAREPMGEEAGDFAAHMRAAAQAKRKAMDLGPSSQVCPPLDMMTSELQ